MKASLFAWLCFAGLFLSSLPASAVEYRWQSLYPYPTGEDFVDIDGSSDHDIWAITSAGSIYHYDGVEWKEHTWLPRRELVAIKVVSRWEAYIACKITSSTRGVILKFDYTGWREWESSFNGSPYALEVLGTDQILVSSRWEDLLYLVTPSSVESLSAPGYLKKIKVVNPTEIYGMDQNKLYRYNGQTWSVILEDGFFVDFDTSPSGRIAVSTFPLRGKLYYYDGNSWTHSEFRDPIGYDLAFVDENLVLAVWPGFPALLWNQGEEIWIPLSQGYRHLFVVGGLSAWLAGDMGAIAFFDGGSVVNHLPLQGQGGLQNGPYRDPQGTVYWVGQSNIYYKNPSRGTMGMLPVPALDASYVPFSTDEILGRECDFNRCDHWLWSGEEWKRDFRFDRDTLIWGGWALEDGTYIISQSMDISFLGPRHTRLLTREDGNYVLWQDLNPLYPSGIGGRSLNDYWISLRENRSTRVYHVINGNWEEHSPPASNSFYLEYFGENDIWTADDDGFYRWNGVEWSIFPSRYPHYIGGEAGNVWVTTEGKAFHFNGESLVKKYSGPDARSITVSGGEVFLVVSRYLLTNPQPYPGPPDIPLAGLFPVGGRQRSATASYQFISYAETPGPVGLQIYYQGLPTGVLLKDDGQNGDFEARDGWFGRRLDLNEPAPPGRYLLELAIEEEKGDFFVDWPYLTVKP